MDCKLKYSAHYVTCFLSWGMLEHVTLDKGKSIRRVPGETTRARENNGVTGGNSEALQMSCKSRVIFFFFCSTTATHTSCTVSLEIVEESDFSDTTYNSTYVSDVES